MNDYSQNDITIRIDNDPHQEIILKLFDDDFPNGDYDTRLIFNGRSPEYLQLIIYYKPTDHLFEKFETLLANDVPILSLIKPIKGKTNWDFPDFFDFSKSNIIEIQENHQWEHNKKPLILVIDNVDILVTSRYVGDARFKLTINIFQHLDKYIKYGQLARQNLYDKFIDENKNIETRFGCIRFILSYMHFYDSYNSIKNINITRDAYLTITDKTGTLTDQQLIEHGNYLCLLMSFYWEKTIDFYTANVRVNNIEHYKTREILRFSNHLQDDNSDFLLKDRYLTFYSFIDCVNYKKFTTYNEMLNELIPRIIKTKTIDEISAFMILYNIIEKIRNYFLANPLDSKQFTIKEEFVFTKSNKFRDEFIKKKIKEIKEIVAESDIQDFDKKASDKVTFIRKTGLKEQFDSLLIYLQIDSKSYGIDFTNLIKIRNNIYHGKLPQEEIKPYVKQMTVLIYDIILKVIM